MLAGIHHDPITSFVKIFLQAPQVVRADFLGDSLTSCGTDACFKATSELAIEFTFVTQYVPSIAPPKGEAFPHFLV